MMGVGQMETMPKIHHKCCVIVFAPNPLLAGLLKTYLDRYRLVDFSARHKFPAPMSDELPICIVDQDVATPAPYGATRLVRAKFPDAGILVLGRDFSGPQVFSLLLEGVRGFLAYERVPQELLRAVETVASAGLWCSPDRLQQACLHMQNVWRSRTNGCFRFTPRQKEIVDLVSKKLTNKEIAYHLSISENTVKFHLSKVFRKLGATNRGSVTELLRQAN